MGVLARSRLLQALSLAMIQANVRNILPVDLVPIKNRRKTGNAFQALNVCAIAIDEMFSSDDSDSDDLEDKIDEKEPIQRHANCKVKHASVEPEFKVEQALEFKVKQA